MVDKRNSQFGTQGAKALASVQVNFPAVHAPGEAPSSTADASLWGVVFQRELYEAAAVVPHRHQTLMVPGVADVVERSWREPLSTGACTDD